MLYLASIYFKVISPIFDCLAYFYIGGLSVIAFKYIEKTKDIRTRQYREREREEKNKKIKI